MKKFLLALSALALVAMIWLLPTDYDVLAEGATTVSGSDVSGGNASTGSGNTSTGSGNTSTGSGNTSEVTTPAAPEIIGVSDNFKINFKIAEGCEEGRYYVELLKDGEYVASRAYNKLSVGQEISCSAIEGIEESGVYQYRVRYMSSTNTSTAVLGAWGESEKITYTKPDQKVETVTVAWNEENPTVAEATTVENCGGYVWRLYKLDEESGEDLRLTTIVGVRDYAAGVLVSHDFANKMAESGKYRVQVRLLSSDLTKYAHSDWSEFTSYYDTEKVSQEVEDVVESVVEQSKTDAAGAVSTIVNNTNLSDLRVAMQTDEDVQAQIAEVEKNYIAQQNIDVKATTASAEVKNMVATDKIKMVGAAFNAAAGNSINLDVTIPTEKKDIDAKYDNSVQLDIKLVTAGAEKHGKLLVPITITMPVPEGIDVDDLDIIHYFVSGGYEHVQFKDNEDGTITFTVDQFSTFVFANEAEDEEDEDDDDEEDEDKAIVSPAKDNVPKTGDSLPIALPMAMTVVLAGVALALKKREE